MSHENITIGTARWLAKKNNLQGCMIVVIDDGQVKGVSYGADRAKCSQLGAFMNRAMELLDSGRIPFSAFGAGTIERDDRAEAAMTLCPFCGKEHKGPLPCSHCGEPDTMPGDGAP